MAHESEDTEGATVQRVLVVGGPGSGKTTLARTLAAALRLPHHDLDRVAYDPTADEPDAPFWQWLRVSDDQRRERVAALAVTDGWVADGLYAGWTTPLRDAADVILWLDLPAHIAAWRVLRRAAGHWFRGGRDWDLRSVRRVARSAQSYRTRPEATADQLRERDGANSSRMLEVFLLPVTDKVIRCSSPAEVRRAVGQITRRRSLDSHDTPATETPARGTVRPWRHHPRP
jgi:adenylate kinase family enzyme